MTLRLMTNKTFRDMTEANLLEIFPKRLKSMQSKYIDIIANYEEEASETPYHKLISLAGKQDEFSRSTNHPDGLFFYDSERDAIFAVGVLFKAEAPEQPHIYIIGPRGNGWAEAVEEFIEKIEHKIPKARFHVKELSTDNDQMVTQHPNFFGVIVNCNDTRKTISYTIATPSSKMRMIEDNPWIQSAPQQSFPPRMLMLNYQSP